MRLLKYILAPVLLLLVPDDISAQEKLYKELMARDWPDLKRYAAANREIAEQQNYPKVVFMGNSITEVWADHHPEFFREHQIAGRGISGQTTPQMLIRFTPDVIDLRPKIAVILAGTNDIAGNTGYASVKMITDNIKAMAQLAQANGIRVVLCSILPVYDYAWRPGLEPVEKISQVNAWIKDFAGENNHIYVDYFSALSDEKKGMKKIYSEDGVHPNAAGYRVMEPIVLKGIERALKN
ncbi:SGNH/GDSL hydrolase family protein [Robertkochia flava]|uniref:SGNH/GDSL hydrolase family protein n=1 Tax=Robertkochia flava TaxID=3447986 RepID=UPI001CCD85D3|nr:SGNH/GDSL hydrolase family protein [Robertkochia marina]